MTPTTTEKIDERLTPLLLQLPTLPYSTTNLQNDCMQVSDASAIAFSLLQGALCGANAHKLTTIMVERRTRFFIVETSDRLLRGCTYSSVALVRNCTSARTNLSLLRFIFGMGLTVRSLRCCSVSHDFDVVDFHFFAFLSPMSFLSPFVSKCLFCLQMSPNVFFVFFVSVCLHGDKISPMETKCR